MVIGFVIRKIPAVPFKMSTTYPLLNLLKGGLITLRLLKTQCRPIRTLARSPRTMHSAIIIVYKNQREISPDS